MTGFCLFPILISHSLQIVSNGLLPGLEKFATSVSDPQNIHRGRHVPQVTPQEHEQGAHTNKSANTVNVSADQSQPTVSISPTEGRDS